MNVSNAPISFPGLFGDWQFTVPSKALDIGNGVYWYGIIIAAGMLLGLYFCMKQAPKYGLSEDNIIDTVLWVVPFSIIGARIYYVLFYLDLFRRSDGSINWSSTYRIWDGGLAIYGAVIAVVIVGICVSRHRGYKLGAMLDLAVMGLLIGQCIGRWGNFFNREAFGASTLTALRMGLYNTLTGTVEYYHPTFLYESVWNLAGFVLLHFLSKKRTFDGQVALGYAAWYGLGRTFIEGLRMDSLYWGSVRVSQLLAAVTCAGTVAVLLWQSFRPHDPAKMQVRLAEAAAREKEAAEEAETPPQDENPS